MEKYIIVKNENDYCRHKMVTKARNEALDALRLHPNVHTVIVAAVVALVTLDPNIEIESSVGIEPADPIATFSKRRYSVVKYKIYSDSRFDEDECKFPTYYSSLEKAAKAALAKKIEDNQTCPPHEYREDYCVAKVFEVLTRKVNLEKANAKVVQI